MQIEINDGPNGSDIESARAANTTLEFVTENRTTKLLLRINGETGRDEAGNLTAEVRTSCLHGQELEGTLVYSTENRTGEAIIHDYNWMYSEALRQNETMGLFRLPDREIVEIVDSSNVKYFEPVKTGHTMECVRCQRKFFGAPTWCGRCRGTNFRAITT